MTVSTRVARDSDVLVLKMYTLTHVGGGGVGLEIWRQAMKQGAIS
jgi:hypothetical protein